MIDEELIKQIKDAHRKIAKLIHPDLQPAHRKALATAIMQEANRIRDDALKAWRKHQRRQS